MPLNEPPHENFLRTPLSAALLCHYLSVSETAPFLCATHEHE